MFAAHLSGFITRSQSDSPINKQPHLHGAFQLWNFDAKVDLTGNGHADEQPVVEAKVVDQLENIWHRQVDESHATLGMERGTENSRLTCKTARAENKVGLTLKSRAGMGVNR